MIRIQSDYWILHVFFVCFFLLKVASICQRDRINCCKHTRPILVPSSISKLKKKNHYRRDWPVQPAGCEGLTIVERHRLSLPGLVHVFELALLTKTRTFTRVHIQSHRPILFIFLLFLQNTFTHKCVTLVDILPSYINGPPQALLCHVKRA